MNNRKPRADMLILWMFLFALLIGCGQSQTKNVALWTPPRFHVGEVWNAITYSNQPPGVSLQIAQVDFDAEAGQVVMVLPRGLKGWYATMNFIPFSEKALMESVTTLVATNRPLSSAEIKLLNGFNSEIEQGVRGGYYKRCFEITYAEFLAMKIKEQQK